MPPTFRFFTSLDTSATFLRGWLLLTGLLLWMDTAKVSAEDAKTYLDEVKPLLRERCYACHGALKQKGRLRLDTAQRILAAEVIANGELLARVTSQDPEKRMPHEGAPLKPAQIAILRRWIDAGTPAPENEAEEADPKSHWAFQRIERPPVPAGAFCNPVDAFLGAKQSGHSLKVQPEAERSILIRRASLDLTGLPPTEAQLTSQAPFEETVDRLLESPQYGERWGRHWMDVWRYSDWYGLGAQLRNSQKHLWHWRDWIVQSLNTDKGYDRMVEEMLAGDEIAPDDIDSVTGTGFLARNYYLFNRTTWLDDTIEHTAKAFLGLTMNCAKCHDHKYDPISQVDYYRFRAIFEPHQIRLDEIPGETDFEKDGLPRAYDDQPGAETFLHVRGDPAHPDKETKITPGVPAILAGFETPPRPVELPLSAWAPGARDFVRRDLLRAAETRLADAEQALKKAREARATPPPLQSAAAPASPKAPAAVITDAFDTARPELWTLEGPGWRYQGGSLAQLESTRDKQFARTKIAHPADFDLTLKFRTTGGGTYKSVGIRFDVSHDGSEANTVYASAHAPGPKVQIAHTKGNQTTYPSNGKIDRPIQLNRDHELGIRVRDRLINVTLNGEFLLAYTLPGRTPGGLLELFAFDATAEFDSLEVHPLPLAVALKDAGAPAKAGTTVNPAAALELAEARVAESETGLRSLQARIAADDAALLGKDSGAAKEAALLERKHAVAAARVELLTAEAGKVDAAMKALAAAEKNLQNSDTAHTPVRGSFKALETPEHTQAQYPATYAKVSTGRRTALARWITSRENPLTARVAVNHIWMRHFGEPLVETVFDFGLRAPKPEHADLLDYLAAELIDSGWSMKHLHRLLLTSRTWRRSSSNLGADPQTLAADPANHFYWRMAPRRMESEVLRDSLLQLGGQLDLQAGGPSLEAGGDSHRRSLYLKHSRDDQSLLLATFDDADILACYRRSESIVPQQALALSNSKLSLDTGRLLAGNIGPVSDDRAFALKAFSLVLCRAPTEEELTACLEFLKAVPKRDRLVHALLNHNDFVMIR